MNSPAPKQHAYGAHPAQFGELSRPSGDARPGTVVVIHGGFWRSRYDLSLGRPLARDLATRGYTVWNLEYRRVGDGGGWPATLGDVAAGIDHLSRIDADTAQVVAVGHSAGGHLAVWSAGRGTLPPDAPGAAPLVHVTGAIAQAGVLDLKVAAITRVGHGAVADLLGGMPADRPDRYAAADPIEQVPLQAPVVCLHSRADSEVPFAQSASYVSAATAAGGQATLYETAVDHYTLIDPRSADWAIVLDTLPGMLTG